MFYFCCGDKRRADVLNSPLNGIDFLEVVDSKLPGDVTRQRTLNVHFLKDLAGFPLGPANVRIEGGERVPHVRVLTAPAAGKVLAVAVDQPGDYSPYTLRLVANPDSDDPPAGIDPATAAVAFSFKVECPTDFDCRPTRECPPLVREEPEIDYLAKDYASFRAAMLDRLSLLMPGWRERNPADIGVTLVELLAHVGDLLSYHQDAVGTEAYLGTARRRVSVRRHALLVDYRIDDGASARTWVHLHVPNDVEKKTPPPVAAGTPFLTRLPDRPPLLPRVPDVLPPDAVVFEACEDVFGLYTAHNEMTFYTWSGDNCCLPRGATRAYLNDDAAARLRLCPGDVLIFEEKRDPATGQPADADPSHRRAVRLTAVNPAAVKDVDGVTRTPGPLRTDAVTKMAYVEIAWADADALPFPLCVSATTDADHGTVTHPDVSVARGNVVLADHGQTVGEPLPPVSPLTWTAAGGDRCDGSNLVAVPPRYRPTLTRRGLAHVLPDNRTRPAAAARVVDGRADPAIQLDGEGTTWTAVPSLLDSRPLDPHFVTEVETDGTVQLRFGDGTLGRRPATGTTFAATYRVGVGTAGNVGRDSLYHVVADLAGATVRNPLPAWGGRDPEGVERVRQKAPSAFRRQERAVTEADYAEVTERDPDVQRAAATFRWTGSWHTAFVTADRVGGRPVDAKFVTDTRQRLERYRMAGQDLDFDAPRPAALEVELHVCAAPDYLRSQVKAAVMRLFTAGVLPDGTLGLFHPDRFTFGQTVYLSPLVAAAQGVAGVTAVTVKLFQRYKRPETSGLDAGELAFGRLEVPRLDNDPNFPERGVFTLTVGGGR